MPFIPGDPNINREGRKKGVPNSTTEAIRAVFADFLAENVETLQQDYDAMTPRERLAFIEKVARLVLPPPMPELERLTDQQLDEVINKIRQNSLQPSRSLQPSANS